MLFCVVQPAIDKYTKLFLLIPSALYKQIVVKSDRDNYPFFLFTNLINKEPKTANSKIKKGENQKGVFDIVSVYACMYKIIITAVQQANAPKYNNFILVFSTADVITVEESVPPLRISVSSLFCINRAL